MTSQRLLSTREVAARLGVDPRTAARMVQRGDLTPAMRAPGSRGAFLFNVDDVDQLAERVALELRERLEQMEAAS